MRSKPRAGRGRAGFSLAELMVVTAIIGLMTYVVAQSFDAIVPQERLNTAVRNLTAVLRDARSAAIAKNLPHQVEYDLPNRRDRLLYPNSLDGGILREGYDSEERRLAGQWNLLPDGIDFQELSVAGEPYRGDVPYRVIFDPRGSATEHLVVLSQPRYEAFYTIEVLALSGHFRMHDGVWQRDVVSDQDFK
ncbi:MAG: prepilin-type N-terminal cleavage/methylation domain-containing protein [Planctomycetota bacterium]